MIGKKFFVAAISLVATIGAVVALNVTGTGILAANNPCTDDQIVRCGVTSTNDLLDKYDRNVGDIKNIYSHYGISRDDIAGKTSVMKLGTVMRNGDVVVDNKVVATGAYSVSRIKYTSVDTGREPRAVPINGTTYYEGPDMGTFKKGINSVSAFVYMRNGQFHKAILIDCANPLIATPEPAEPIYSCDSLTAQKIERNKFEFTSNATAKNGAEIVSYNYDFGDGTKKNNESKTITHVYNTDVAKTYTAKVTVNIKVNGKVQVVSGDNCQKTVTVEKKPVEPKPVFTCEGLKISEKISRTEFKLTATASAENATIKSYTFKFGDGKSETVSTNAKTATVKHTYPDTAEEKAYTAEVTVTMSDGQTAKANENCKVVVTVKEKDAPSIAIDKKVNDKEHAKVAVGEVFTYQIVVRNTGNVVLKNAVVTDTAPEEVTLLSASTGSIDNNVWTYTIPELKVGESKSFTIKAKYEKYVEGTHKNTVCVDTPTIPSSGKPDDCDDATTETDEPIEVCDLTDNTVKTIKRSEFDPSHMTTDLDKCAEIPVTPPELPKTGMETFISGGIGIGSITAAGYYWAASRRNLLDALLGK